jgi:ubiquinone/menaquinone biosynthesis C-methylase UbiE
MPDEREIYNQHAEEYERLVLREDYQGNIIRALAEIHPLEDHSVVELGAGTGRLTRMLAPLVSDIWLFDISPHMLEVAADALQKAGAKNWGMAVADHRKLPLVDDVADLVISGWSVSYLAVWGDGEWKKGVREALREMERVLRRGGMIVLLETLGTGHEQPEEPEKLKEYYECLGREGFSRRWIRTDFEFESLAEAKELTGFFFGQEMAARVGKEKLVRLPECTGICWKTV